jgi:predicted Zn-dependent protease
MRRWSWLVSSLAFIAVLPGSAHSQVSGPETPAQIRKEFVLGQQLAGELERKDGRINNPAIVDCVQRIANRLAGATGGKALDVRITQGSDRYAYLLPHGVLYISGALLERVESEAEIAGLLAHQLAHLRQQPACVLASAAPFRSVEDRRESELLATKAAIETLRSAGYEPSAVLDLLSKLAYEHPAWAKAIVPEDLLHLRSIVETDVPPQAGYLIDSSQFAQLHASVLEALGHAPRRRLSPRPTLVRTGSDFR